MSDGHIDEVLARVRDAGGRVTTAKRAVVTVLAGSHGEHLTAERIAETVIRNLPDTHLSTIYRILGDLEELGVIRHVHLGHGPSTYHLAGDRHHHAVCDGCGVVVELPADLFDDVASRLEDSDGVVLTAPHFALAGLCQTCAAQSR